MTDDSLSEAELEPCPFCGGAMLFRKALWPSDGCVDGIIHAAPTDCGMIGFSTETIDESVIAAWNTRTAASEAEQRARDKAIEECAKVAERVGQCANARGLDDRLEALGEDIADAIRALSSARGEG